MPRKLGRSLDSCPATILILVGSALLLTAADTAESANKIADSASGVGGEQLDGSARPVLKPLLRGLVAMGNTGFIFRGMTPDNDAALQSVESASEAMAGMVVNVSWAQIEPQQGKFATEAVDHVLAAAAAYNLKHSMTPIRLKLRVYGGNQAPEWAKNLGGLPIAALRMLFGRAIPIKIGRFWADEYGQAWSQMQHELAARFDANPLISEVSDTSCTSETGEPDVLPNDPSSLANLAAAGFTNDAYIRCLQLSYVAFSGWHTTRIDRAFNAFHLIEGTHTVSAPDQGLNLMTSWRQRLGNQAIINLHSLGRSAMVGSAGSTPNRLYAHMRSLGPPIEFQLFAPLVHNSNFNFNIDALTNAMQEGIGYGATAVELWPNEITPNPPIDGYAAILKRWSSALQANGPKS